LADYWPQHCGKWGSPGPQDTPLGFPVWRSQGELTHLRHRFSIELKIRMVESWLKVV
jgi:hypothetical protein